MFWRDYPTKKAVTDAIQTIINAQPFKIPFESILLSDLIAERHYFCSIKQLRPLRFRKLPGYGAYQFEGEFAEIGWHSVSWTKCLKPRQTAWDKIKQAMRDRAEPVKAEYRKTHPMCEQCGSPAMETHHSQPSFNELAEIVRKQFSDADISSCLAEWNWFERDNFALPESHSITMMFDRLHSTAVLQSLCRECHNLTKRRSI